MFRQIDPSDAHAQRAGHFLRWPILKAVQVEDLELLGVHALLDPFERRPARELFLINGWTVLITRCSSTRLGTKLTTRRCMALLIGRSAISRFGLATTRPTSNSLRTHSASITIKIRIKIRPMELHEHSYATLGYSLKTQTIDNHGLMATSAPVRVTIGAGLPPSFPQQGFCTRNLQIFCNQSVHGPLAG